MCFCTAFSLLHLPYPLSSPQNINSTSEEATLHPQLQVLCLAHRGCISFLLLGNKYHHFSSLNPHLFISSQPCKSGIQAQGGSILQPSQAIRSRNQGISQAEFLNGGSGEESASKLVQIVGKLQLHEIIRLWPPFPCCQPGAPLSN